MPALVMAGSGSAAFGAVRLNQEMNRFISDGTCFEGGASKCTLGEPIRPETTCIGSWLVRYRPMSARSFHEVMTVVVYDFSTAGFGE